MTEPEYHSSPGDLGDTIAEAVTSSGAEARVQDSHRQFRRQSGQFRRLRTPTSEIIRLYLEERLSLSEVARQLGISRGIVEKRIKESGHKLRSVAEGTRLVKLGRPRLKLPLRTHPGERPVDKWKIVELKVAGESNREIAKQLNRAQPSIYMALRRMGFPDRTRVTSCYSFGEVFDRAALRRLHGISGLNVTQLAQELDVPFGTLEAALSTRKPQKQLHFNTARKVVEWRKSLFQRLMSGASRNPGRQTGKYGQSRVLVTFFPNLRERYSFLLKVLRRLGEDLRRNPAWSAADLQRHLWGQAMLEQARQTPGDLFIRFLPWAPELTPSLASKLGQLRDVHHQSLAYEIIARSLGTTGPTISAVINPALARKIKSMTPAQMRALIPERDQALPKAVPSQPRKRGKPPNASVQARIPRLRQLKGEGKSWGQIRKTMNLEYGLKLGKTAYRNLLDRN